MKRQIYSLMSLFLIAGCTQNSKSASNVYGQIEVDEVDVSSRVPARVAKILVQPGQAVKAGDILVEFEDDVIAAKKGQAMALVAQAESRKEISQDAVRPEEKEQLRAALSAAEKQMKLAKSSFDRAEAIFKEGAISEQALDEIKFKRDAAIEQWRTVDAKMRMAKIGARAEDKKAAQALVDQAKNAVAEAEAFSKDLRLKSPVDGEVYQVLCQEGELVPAGYPVANLIKTSNPWVAFHVVETRLADFPMKKSLTFEIPALKGEKVNADIFFVSPMAGFANRTTVQDRGQFDLRTFEIRARLTLNNPSLRPGMTAILRQ